MTEKEENMQNKEKFIQEFSKEFPVTENRILAKKYKVAESTIRVWGSKMKLKKESWVWVRSHENYVLKYYNKKKSADIAKKLNRTRWAVINKYRELSGLRKKK